MVLVSAAPATFPSIPMIFLFLYFLFLLIFLHFLSAALSFALVLFMLLCHCRRRPESTIVHHKQMYQQEIRDNNIENRLPWLTSGCQATTSCGLLTTSAKSEDQWHGTIIQIGAADFDPAPWISSGQLNPGIIWYWIREGEGTILLCSKRFHHIVLARCRISYAYRVAHVAWVPL